MLTSERVSRRRHLWRQVSRIGQTVQRNLRVLVRIVDVPKEGGAEDAQGEQETEGEAEEEGGEHGEGDEHGVGVEGPALLLEPASVLYEHAGLERWLESKAPKTNPRGLFKPEYITLVSGVFPPSVAATPPSLYTAAPRSIMATGFGKQCLTLLLTWTVAGMERRREKSTTPTASRM